MKDYKTSQNKYKYKTKISLLKQEAMTNYQSMKQIERQEKDMIDKLRTTFLEVRKTEEEIRTLERGNAQETKSLKKLNLKFESLLKNPHSREDDYKLDTYSSVEKDNNCISEIPELTPNKEL